MSVVGLAKKTATSARRCNSSSSLCSSTDITDMYRIFSVIHGKIEEISKLIYRKKIRIPGIKVKEVGGNFGLCSGIYGWIWVDSYGKAVLGGRLRKG